MRTSRFTKVVVVAVLATLLIPIGATPAEAFTPPTMAGLKVSASDGHQWRTYGGLPCTTAHGFAISGSDPGGTIVTPGDDISIPLADGASTYTLIGTGAPGSVATMTLGVSVDGTVLEVGEGPVPWSSPVMATASATLSGRVVTIGNFRMHTPTSPTIDRASTCEVAPDGVPDSYATFDAYVTPVATAPSIDALKVDASDGGGWKTYPTSEGCGIFHLFAIPGDDPNGTIVNPAGGIEIPLVNGSSRYTVIGTDGNDPGVTQTLTLNIGGDVVTVGEIGSFSPPTVATATAMGHTVVVSNFHFDASSTRPHVDNVGICSVGGDGYWDSYGTFDVFVTQDAPTVDVLRVAASDGGGWWDYPISQGCGVFHAFTIAGTDPHGTITNPAGDITIPLTNGAATYTVIGTDANTAGATQKLQVQIDGVEVFVGEGPLFTPPVMATATVMARGKRIDIGSFRFDASSTRPVIDRVGICSVGADGYNDSYGTFNLVVTDLPPDPPRLDPVRVIASGGGGWVGYSTAAPCGPFHAFAIAGTNPNGTILNPGGEMWLPAVDGPSDYTVIGNDGNTPGATQQLEVSVDGVPVIIGEGPSFTPPVMATATVMARGKRIDIGSFRFDASSTRPTINRVGNCSVGADGYNDSYGSFRVVVSPG